MALILTKDKSELLKNFSKGFSSFLARKGLRTQDIAKELDVTDSAVSSWKYGRAFPDVPNFLRLVELGLSFVEITPYIHELYLIESINDKEAEVFQLLRMAYDSQMKRDMETDEDKIALWEKSIEDDEIKLRELQKIISGKKERLIMMLERRRKKELLNG